ncbi:DNA cytosine methyltransferase [Saxibacter everestensis]|uniref:DNA cytosine methyltransferase n=1 Tax=Saxibacter everestensis TaxID=2909229 RepID=A0ABY8QRT0_9MICO|nr:DNA cytosine methyltransferase [Brevibacteriaceae bacterium ZFBP1038]
MASRLGEVVGTPSAKSIEVTSAVASRTTVTTGGGSSKQALVIADRGEMKVRWLTPVECARLMGADKFKTRARTDNQELFGFGDAVVVDVIAWIADHYLLPLLRPAVK